MDDYQDSMDELWKQIFTQATRMTEKHHPQMVAATYMAIAMRLYKTALQDAEYKAMMEFVLNTDVNPFDKPTYH